MSQTVSCFNTLMKWSFLAGYWERWGGSLVSWEGGAVVSWPLVAAVIV